jgi:sugar lactone lactonase YvrE
MKTFKLLLTLLLLLPLLSVAQDTLNYPTDVVYDETSETYYISNWAYGDGFISTMNTSGEITGTLFSDLQFPEGLCLIGTTLYVVDNGDLYGGSAPSYLVGIDINSGVEVLKFEIAPSGTNLDLMTTDNSGNLFICDSEELVIYKYEIASGTLSVFVEGINKPLGICYDDIDNRIIFTESKASVSYLKSISPEGGAVSNIFYFLGWIEGVVMDADGDYYFSSWTGNGSSWGTEPVFKMSHAMDWKFELMSDQNRPFGMCMGHDNYLVICNWGSHIVNFFNLEPFGTEENAFAKNNLSVFPNPGNGEFQIQLNKMQSKYANITIMDLNGKIVDHRNIHSFNDILEESFDLGFLPSGMYMLMVEDGDRIYREKLIIN